MAGLDARGDISVALVCVYVPISILALILTLRHGFSRQAGWVSLLLFAVGSSYCLAVWSHVTINGYYHLFLTVRIVGGVLHIVVEKISNPSTGLYTAAFALESAGVTTLLLCTIAFIGIMFVSFTAISSLCLADSELYSATNSIEKLPFASPQIMRLVHLALVGAIALSVTGASNSGSSSENTRNTGVILRKAGAIVLLAVLFVCSLLHFMLWGSKRYILLHRRTVRFYYTVFWIIIALTDSFDI